MKRMQKPNKNKGRVSPCAGHDRDSYAQIESPFPGLVVHDYGAAMREELERYTPQGRININRQIFLNELRSGKYKKGTTLSDEKGKPVFAEGDDQEGYCACAVMLHLFSPLRFSTKEAMSELGLTSKDCQYIQQQINDTDLDFAGIADRIDNEVFKR